jgi:hypothetical protein
VQDELDAQLLRRFALADRPAADEAFTTAVAQRIGAARHWRLSARGVYGVFGTICGGLAVAASALRLRHARLMMMGAAAVTLWAAFF